MHTCEFCLKTFKTIENLVTHQNKTQYCKNYRTVSFKCKLCNFETVGIKNIDEHIENCKENNNQETIGIEKRIENLKKENEQLSKLLSIEKMKSSILTDIINSNLNINISNFFHTEQNTVNFFQKEELSFTISENLETIKKEDKKVKKQNFRSIKCISSTKENEDTNVEKEESTSKNENEVEIPYTFELYKEDIIKQYDLLNQTRNYSKILEDIKNKRWKIFKYTNINDYIKLLYDHVDKINNYFIEREFNPKKIKSIISKSLFPVESRLIYYENYFQSFIEVDEIDNFKVCLEYSNSLITEYIPYNETTLYNNFYNYSIVLFPIYRLMNILISKTNKFNNIIYLPLPKSNIENPYSFYKLVEIKNGKRYWEMDCRLECFSFSLATCLLDCMITTFRKIYKNIFNDNDFRVDYEFTSQITECDLEQLLQNIITVSKPKKFCLELQKIIMNNSTFINTDNDKFNLSSDDPLQKKKFLELENPENLDIYKRIFDNITIEESIKISKTKTIT
jgi:hypothetical protein